MFSTPGDSQVTRTTLFIESTGTTPAEMTLDGQPPGSDNVYTIPGGHTGALTVTIAARDTTGSIFAMFKRMLITSVAGSIHTIGTDINPHSLSVSITSGGGLVITVSSPTSATIHWLAEVEALEIG